MNRYHRRQQSGFAEVAIVSIAKGIWFLISWPFKKILKLKTKSEKLDKIKNHRKWLEIEKLLESGDEIHARQAVVEADKFFDNIMKQVGVQGQKFADRLRSLENHMNHNNYQAIWQAHKIRNQITHEVDHKISVGEVKQVLNKFRRGLVNLGAL